MQCHKLGRIPNIQDVKSADCNWIKEGNKTVEVYIEINTGQARLVESMLISLREHVYVLFFHKWTTNRNWQHWVHETQNKDKLNKNTTQYVFNSTICIHTNANQKWTLIQTSFVCGNRNRHHNMELQTYRHIIGQHTKKWATQTQPRNRWGM